MKCDADVLKNWRACNIVDESATCANILYVL